MGKRKEYEEYLNNEFSTEGVLSITEHCWAGNKKTRKEKNHALKLAKKGLLGTVLKKYDPVGFNAGFNDWVRN